MASTEVMTSSPHSFACSYRLVKKCFVKICETLKCHNFLIFQPIFIRFSLLSLKIFTFFSEIKLNLFRISPFKLLLILKFFAIHKHESCDIDNFIINIFKGSRSHLQIFLNITKLCKDEKFAIVMMYMKYYCYRL